MLEKIETSFRDILASLQTAKLYATQHPIFKKSVDKAYLSLLDVLRDRDEVVIGIVADELAFETEILFDLSRAVKLAVIYLKERGIEKLAFHRGVEKEELDKLIAFLAAPAGEVKLEPQDYLSSVGVKNITISKIDIDGTSVKDTARQAVNPLAVYKSSLDKIQQVLTAVLDGENFDYLMFRFAMNNILDNLQLKPQEFLRLAALRKIDLGIFNHSLDVAVLSLRLALELGFAKDAVMDIGIAALFHDIGRLYIAHRSAPKGSAAKPAEAGRIKSHVIFGAELMLKYLETAGKMPVVVCLEHHLGLDLKGYPRLNYLSRAHLASLIVAICDSYNSLASRRKYKSDYSPEQIYRLMQKGRGKAFEPRLLDKFFEINGIWPIGTLLNISGGRVALVIAENRDEIDCPQVEVILPKEAKERIDLRTTKGSIKIEGFVNPFTNDLSSVFY
ncbi:MAG: hypothetical protein A3G38_02855 [Omnitrophica WOR_2 bacterium RIFCSPLOWO2_12_FULL_51_8]|nr:MAG: hypothetical protein A3G38_02855 [Omnitrophica WOR_2 bacterium RIFCSPLOWO2_12_FULL_51_8]